MAAQTIADRGVSERLAATLRQPTREGAHIEGLWCSRRSFLSLSRHVEGAVPPACE